MQLLIPPPLVLVIAGVAMWAMDRMLPFARVTSTLLPPLAMALLVSGLVLMIAAAASLVLSRTTINPLRPDNASRLITSGIFRRSRNPIYLGDLLLLAAWALWLGNALNAAWLGAFVWYIQRYQIAPEERALSRLFGETYRTYCANVRRWL